MISDPVLRPSSSVSAGDFSGSFCLDLDFPTLLFVFFSFNCKPEGEEGAGVPVGPLTACSPLVNNAGKLPPNDPKLGCDFVIEVPSKLKPPPSLLTFKLPKSNKG